MTTPNLKLTAIQLGDSATPANNFLVCVPDVADGTMVIKRGNDTVVATIDAAGKVVFAGNAQTWQNVAGARIMGTTYQNTTGQPIDVAVSCVSTSPFHIIAYVGDLVVYTTTDVAANTVVANAYLRVPAGHLYTISVSAGTPSIYSWSELR